MATIFTKGKFLPLDINSNEIRIKDFESTKFIGSGSFGRVYKMVRKYDHIEVAVKALNKAAYFTKSRALFDQLKHEIEIHSRLRHPHIIRLYGRAEDLKNIYMIMEYADGGTLQDRIRHKARMSEKDIFKFFSQICDAVKFLYESKLIHRDIKPANVLITKEEEAKLTDFGCCISIEDHQRRLCGTPEYIAPEAIKTNIYNEESDIWSLGILLYEMIYGTVPFTGKSIEKILETIIDTELVLDMSVARDANELISRMLEKDPKKRITMIEIAESSWVKRMLKGDKLESESASPSIFDKILSFFGNGEL